MIDDRCREWAFAQLNRRSFLKVGAVASFGATLAGALRANAAGETRTAQAKSVILLWLQGGVSHLESFDPKPDAPSEVRGEMSPIKTKLPGVYFNQHLPKLAELADKISVVRSLKHSEAGHERGSMYVVEGRRPEASTGVNHSGNPELGSIVAHELGNRGRLPPFFSIPGNDFTSTFTGQGWLPAVTGAFRGVHQQAFKVNERVDLTRFQDRVDLRHSLLSGERESASNWDAFDRQAVEIITSRRAAAAFDLSKEPASLRARYGLSSQRKDDMASLALTARRLVEAGVRFVTVGRDNWDHHVQLFPKIRERLPRFDDAFSALLNDLEQRGMLDETLVVYLTEFGRSPKINNTAGREHWPNACSVVFAGAGIKRGQVIGATDAKGGEVIAQPVSPEEIAATILHLVGIHPQTTVRRSDGRPVSYIDTAKPIEALLA